MQFRVVTLNLEQDHKRWSDRHPLISAEIAGLRPDVIALNEVCVPLQTARLLRDSAITRTGIPYKLVQQTRAEDLISWVDDTDIDGFNLSRIVTPEGLEDFVDLVVPILQERGVYKRDYRPGTLREIVRQLAAAAAEPPGRRAPPVDWQLSVNVAHLRNARRRFPVARL